MRVPKEGLEENSLIQYVSKMPMLYGFTYFELIYIMKHLIYPSIFSAALWMSRMIDENPNFTVRFKLQEAQKKVSRGLILSELITNDERTRPQLDWNVDIDPSNWAVEADLPKPEDESQTAINPIKKKKKGKKAKGEKGNRVMNVDQLENSEDEGKAS